MRAVLARRTALLARCLGLRAFLPVVPVVLVAVLAVVVVAGAAFFVVAEESGAAGAVVEPAEDWPTTGCTTISKESKAARQRAAWREM